MTERKKTDSLTEAGKNAKAELTEKQLQDISGGPIYMNKLTPTDTQLVGPNLQPAAQITVAKP